VLDTRQPHRLSNRETVSPNSCYLRDNRRLEQGRLFLFGRNQYHESGKCNRKCQCLIDTHPTTPFLKRKGLTVPRAACTLSIAYSTRAKNKLYCP